MSRATGKFVFVDSKDVKDPKVEKVSYFRNGELVPDGDYIPMKVSEQVVKTSSGRGTKMALKPIRATLWVYATQTGAAGAAIASTVNCTPANFSDWASYAAVYDEVRVLGGTMHSRFLMSAGTSPGSAAAVCFDPADGVAPASVPQTLDYAQHGGPYAIPSCVAAAPTTVQSPAPVTRTGFHVFKFRLSRDKRSVRNTAQATWIFGDWGATVDAGDIAGFVKTYILGVGGSSTITFDYYLGLDCEFRSRR